MESVRGLQICRLCLFQNDSLIYIFEVNFRHGFVAAEVISDLLHYEVSERDGYPQFVCHQCLNQLNEFTIFKRRCEESKAVFDTKSFKRVVLEEDYNPDEETLEPIQTLQEGTSFESNIHPQVNLSPVQIKQEVPEYESDIHPEVNLSPVRIKQEVPDYESDIHPEASDLDNLPGEEEKQETVLPMLDHTNYTSNNTQNNEIHEDSSTRKMTFATDAPLNVLLLHSSTVGSCQGKVSTSNNPESTKNAENMQKPSENKMILSPENDKRFTCSECGRSFRRKLHLQVHLRTHTGERPFPCEQCGKRFSQRNTLIRHMRSCKISKDSGPKLETKIVCTTVDGKKIFPCPECNKPFSCRMHLEIHLSTTHSGDRPFCCKDCGQCFSEKNNSIKHLPTCKIRKSIFSCPECYKVFQQRSHFENHMRVHSGEKPFPCEQCDQRFSHKNNLIRHLQIHSGERPFFCAPCNKGFTTSSRLEKHCRIHNGEKPFSCEKCSISFSNERELADHSKVHLCVKSEVSIPSGDGSEDEVIIGS